MVSLYKRVYNKQESRVVVEKILGRILNSKVIIHHIDKDGWNNSNNNLVVCPDQAYHKLLHKREDALIACGNPNWRKCSFCKLYDDPKAMMRGGAHQGTEHFRHHLCQNNYNKERYHRLKNEG